MPQETSLPLTTSEIARLRSCVNSATECELRQLVEIFETEPANPLLNNDEHDCLTCWIQSNSGPMLSTIAQSLSRILATSRTKTLPLGEWAQKYLKHYFTHPGSLMHEWLVESLCRLHTERGQKLAVIAPRGSAKTTWISKTYPLYCAVYELEPYIVLASNTTAQSERNLEAIRRELESNVLLARDFPNSTGAGPVWNNAVLETRNGIRLESVGRETSIRGRTFGPHRPSLIIVDDLENDHSAHSDKQRDLAEQWLMRTAIPAGTDETNAFVLGTALHHDDLLHRLEKRPGWRVRRFKAIIDEPPRSDLWSRWKTLLTDSANEKREQDARAFYLTHQTDMEQGAKLLWPERESLYFLMSLRAEIGESAFETEKQGNPIQNDAYEWSREYFGPDIWFDEWPQLAIRVMALDPSKGASETSDYSAFVMLGLGSDGLMYVEADLARRDTVQIAEDALTLAARFEPDAFLIEANQFQSLLYDEIQRLSDERRLLLPLRTVVNTAHKRTRIRSLAPLICKHKFRFKSGSSSASLVVDQLRHFPHAKHDDGPDALDMAVRMLRLLQSGTSDDAERTPMIREIVKP